MTLDYLEEEELLGVRPRTTTANSATKVADAAAPLVEPEDANPPDLNSTTNQTMAGQPAVDFQSAKESKL